MTNKSYHQFCGIAHSLDTIGDRWTLLAVRNLLLGPKRFSDLMRGLPGISTNILTERLKLLEERGVVRTRFLAPPAASTVYELTESGFALADVLVALARWGSLTLGAPQADQAIVDESIGFMTMGLFWRRDKPPFSLTCALHIRDAGYAHDFVAQVSPQGTALEDGTGDADVHLTLTLEPLSMLSSGRLRLSDAIQQSAVRADGTPDAVNQLIDWVDGRAG
ncbi:MAG: helix-turn-helix transcriptional regulator [Pleurocapsa minor GSE-CHR-MK-17-07R]|jgi:DNA-binding HxlR family transcriptional regulator|nr:helix-turn-helix transcriptional regulator [Pleurocapsa minor GSE-CHR-MK 17-07R]